MTGMGNGTVVAHSTSAGPSGPKEPQMTKSELIDALAERGRLPRKMAARVIETILDDITLALAQGERVDVRRFGSFSVRAYNAYQGRNPHTGAQVTVPEKRLPYFKVGKELEARVNGGRRHPEETDR